MKRSEAGLTLIEVLISITLLSLLTVGMLFAIRVGLGALQKADKKLMDNRRVAGAQRVLEQQIAGFVPARALCLDPNGGLPSAIPFFQGQPQTMRMVSTYSLQEAWRGHPRILEFQVIPGVEGKGVRLIVNELPYTGPRSSGRSCLGVFPDGETGLRQPRFAPVEPTPQSFVLADKLAWCRLSYLEPANLTEPEHWRPDWVMPRWPLGIRVEMAPIEDNPARLRPVTITAAIRTNLLPDIAYVD